MTGIGTGTGCLEAELPLVGFALVSSTWPQSLHWLHQAPLRGNLASALQVHLTAMRNLTQQILIKIKNSRRCTMHLASARLLVLPHAQVLI